MLYLSFRVTLLFTSLMGFLMMIAKGEYMFVFFPIVMFFWVFYTFFDEEDTEHRRRNGEYYEIGGSRDTRNHNSGWLHGYYDDIYDNSHTIYTGYDNPYYNKKGNTIRSAEYKNIAKRCKRTLKISVFKESEDNGQPRDTEE